MFLRITRLGQQSSKELLSEAGVLLCVFLTPRPEERSGRASQELQLSAASFSLGCFAIPDGLSTKGHFGLGEKLSRHRELYEFSG